MDIEKIKRFYTRQANDYDFDQICKLLQSHELPTEGIEEHMRHYTVMISNNTGGVLGVIGMEKYGDIGLLRSLAVERGFQGLGFGGQLVCELETHARSSSIRTLYLFTDTAYDYFIKYGYASANRERIDVRLKKSAEYKICESAAFMKKILSE